MKRLLAAIAALMSLMLASCVSLGGDTSDSGSGPGSGSGTPADLTIVAATELKDLQGLVDQAAKDLGFSIDMQFPGGTLDNSQTLKRGDFDGEVDATWFATNRYVNLIGATDKLDGETKIATSPVAFGVWEDSAKRLGWDTKQPTWAEFAQAAEAGEFSFGMTNPQASNSGFSALVAVATALADTGDAIAPADLERVGPRLKQLFQAQSMVSGSSGWLADAFVDDPERADAIVNYEATLHQMRQQGQPIEVVVPADGVISADYPLSALSQPKNADARERVEKLANWLLEHQPDIADTFRRPVTQVDNIPAEIADQQVIELPFPANEGVVDELLTPTTTPTASPAPPPSCWTPRARWKASASPRSRTSCIRLSTAPLPPSPATFPCATGRTSRCSPSRVGRMSPSRPGSPTRTRRRPPS